MGSFKSPARRTEDGVATVHGPNGGLSDGEWIRYWETLPHSAKAKLTSEATSAKVDVLTRAMSATFDPGLAVLARVRIGIVDWNLLDESGQPVAWDPSRAAELIDGLSDETFEYLTGVIGEGGDIVPLAAPADPKMERSETQGEG